MFSKKRNGTGVADAHAHPGTVEPETSAPTAAEPANTETSSALTAPKRRPQGVRDYAVLGATRTKELDDATVRVFATLLEAIDFRQLLTMPHAVLRRELNELVHDILREMDLPLSAEEELGLIDDIVNDTLGLGPLEPLLEDDNITDIMVNSANQVYIERGGRLELTKIHFRDTAQLMNVCTRIANAVGRRIDESVPYCDARLDDGSRVNIIIPPLALDAPMITIRKFRKQRITIEDLVEFGTLSPDAAWFLYFAARCRSNVLISGGTGSGKTTLLNALSHAIDNSERIITVEDTAELRLQQPHVGRLETRPPNIEGIGQVTQRDLVRNCLRMRPDRIIVGEVRGAKAFDMLQAMNTGHEGSMSTIHANSPADSLTRLEDMIAMAGFELPSYNVQKQIASAIDLVVQIERMRDGSRKVSWITEIAGVDSMGIRLNDLFALPPDRAGPCKQVADAAPVRLLDKARRHGAEADVLGLFDDVPAN
jgi:pilus assembly protein CpaF